LQGAHHAKNADTHVELPEDAQQAPHADAGTVFEGGLDHRAAQPCIGREADIVQHVLGPVVALQQGTLTAGFEIQVDVDGDARPPGPKRIRRIGSVAQKVAGHWLMTLRPGCQCHV
jgi:hypothetical protein